MKTMKKANAPTVTIELGEYNNLRDFKINMDRDGYVVNLCRCTDKVIVFNGKLDLPKEVMELEEELELINTRRIEMEKHELNSAAMLERVGNWRAMPFWRRLFAKP